MKERPERDSKSSINIHLRLLIRHRLDSTREWIRNWMLENEFNHRQVSSLSLSATWWNYTRKCVGKWISRVALLFIDRENWPHQLWSHWSHLRSDRWFSANIIDTLDDDDEKRKNQNSIMNIDEIKLEWEREREVRGMVEFHWKFNKINIVSELVLAVCSSAGFDDDLAKWKITWIRECVQSAEEREKEKWMSRFSLRMFAVVCLLPHSPRLVFIQPLSEFKFTLIHG